MKNENDYSPSKKELLNKLRKSGPFWNGQTYETLCNDNLLHEWKVVEHLSRTLHIYKCQKCGKAETIDSGG